MVNSLEGLNFRALFNTSSDALILTDKVGRIIESNHAVRLLLGFSSTELSGQMIESLIPDYYRANRYQDRFGGNGNAKKRAADLGSNLTAPHRDGTQRQIEIYCSDLHDYFLVKLYDIGERILRNQRVSEYAESQRAIVEQSVAGIVQTDLQGNIILTNHCFCEITGYDQRQLLNMNLMALIHPEDRRRHQTLFARLVAENSPFTIETRYVKSNGEVSWVNISGSRINDAYRQPSRCVAVVIDITERTLTALALQASEERLRLAERAANLGIFDIDLTDNSVQCNQRVLDIWGFRADEPLNCRKFLAGMHPEELPEQNLFTPEHIDYQKLDEYQDEYRVIHRQRHTETWVSVSARKFSDGEHEKRVVGIVQDISKRKVSERDRQQSDAAMSTLLKHQVAAQTATAIAHELNQPLAAISAYGEVARQIVDGGAINVEQLNRALNGCVQQAQRAGQTLHKLLKFLQISEINREPININALIEDTITLSRNDGYGGFTTHLQLLQGLPPVYANRLQIKMVLANLIRNGVEAMRGEATYQAKPRIILKTGIKNNTVLVTVQDLGPGLDTETAKHIFDPFFTTKLSGLGMGLAISRALIEANDGLLWWDADNPAGTVFHFTLPFES